MFFFAICVVAAGQTASVDLNTHGIIRILPASVVNAQLAAEGTVAPIGGATGAIATEALSQTPSSLGLPYPLKLISFRPGLVM